MKIFKHLGASFVLWAACSATLAIAAAPGGASDRALTPVNQSTVQSEIVRNRLSLQLAPIRSRASLQQYLAGTPIAQSPFGPLSPRSRARFIDSLTFNERGLTGLRYDVLEAELTATQVYRLLGLFGVQYDTPLVKGARILDDTDRAIMAPNDDRQNSSCGSYPTPSGCPIDHDGYKCESRASCVETIHYICTSNC